MILADGKTRANGDAMRKAAKVLGVKIPTTRGSKSDQELLGNLRVEISKRLSKLAIDDHVKCVVCGEVATDHTEYCPFCGDEGGDVVAEVVAPGVGISKTPVPSAPNVDLATKALEQELDSHLAKIVELKQKGVELSYDIGLECREIRDRQLYKARGHASFKQFAESELPFTRESALQLVSIVDKHSREDYARIGYAKLRIISAVTDSAVKNELMSAARRGNTTVKEIAERAARATQVPSRKTKAPPAEQGEKITLIGKIGARSHVVKFIDFKTGEVVDSAGTFKDFLPDAYGDIEVADGVFVRIGLRVNGKNLEGLTARFVRAADESE